MMTDLYALMWDFGLHTRVTRALLIPRAGTGLRLRGRGTDTMKNFDTILHTYRAHVEDPRLLAFVASIQILQWVDDFVLEQLNGIRWLETQTGHGAFISGHDIHRDINSITNWSRIVGYGELVLANICRHQQIAASLLDALRKWNTSVELPQQPMFQDEPDSLYTALPTLERQPENAKCTLGICVIDTRVNPRSLVPLCHSPTLQLTSPRSPAS